MLVGGAMVNALAFSGSNYLFSVLRSSDLYEERKCHDQAVEQLQAAQAKGSRKRTGRLDWISEDLHRQMHAFRDVDGRIARILANQRNKSCQTSTCKAVAKETVRSPLLYWNGRDRPGGLQTR